MSPKSATKKKPSAKTSKKPAAKKASKPAKSAAPKAAHDPVNGSIVHVEFHTPDLEAAKKFYTEVFGWEIHDFLPNEKYFTTPKSWGPCGCILQGSVAPSTTTIYVNTSDLNGILAKGAQHGATTVKPRTEIPGGHGFFAHMKAPDGNVFGIYSRR